MKKHSTEKPMASFKRWSRMGYAVFSSFHRVVRIGVLAVGMSILLLTAEEVAAQQSDSLRVYRDLQIQEVGVTGTRPSPGRSLQSQTPVFDRASEAAAPLQTLEAAMRLSPSIDVRERSGKGVQADISLRGGSPDQTMVLLNGINFTDARTGHQSHSLPVDLDCVSGIDLVEGITGVGAYAGAVDIRTQPLYPTYLRTNVEGGAYGYLYSNLSGAVRHDRLSLFAAGLLRRSDGYTYNTDFRNVNGYLRMTWDTPQAGYFDVQAGVQGRRFGSNGFYAVYNRDQFEQTSTALGSVRWMKQYGKLRVQANVSYRKNFDRYEWLRGTPTNYHNTDNVGAEWWNELRSGLGTTTLGGDYMYHHIFSSNLGDAMTTPRGNYKCAKSRHVGNLWLRHSWQGRHFGAGASGAVSFTPYGTSVLWSVAGRWSGDTGWHAEAGAAQSMRLPTFTDLYYTSAAQINNLDLKPERAITYHLQTGYSDGKWQLAARLFYRDGRNVIDWVWRDSLVVDGRWVYDKWHSEQSSRLGTFGSEITAEYRPSHGWLRRASLGYGYLTTSRRNDIRTSSVLDYMRHKLSLAVELRFLRRLTWSMTGTLYDRYGFYNRYLRDASGALLTDDAGRMVTEEVEFKPYFLLDGRLGWQKGVLALHVDLSNMTDTNYCDFGGLRRPGFWITAGATFTLR